MPKSLVQPYQISCGKHPAGLEGTLIGVFQRGYKDAKEGVEAMLFVLADDVLSRIVHGGKLDTLLVKNIDALTNRD